jgi:microsomal prostaglandin-E synthase 2
MGGDQPNLADLAVYGALSAMEGMDAFNDVMNNTSISSWYYSVQHQVTNHNGHTDAISFIINNN